MDIVADLNCISRTSSHDTAASIVSSRMASRENSRPGTGRREHHIITVTDQGIGSLEVAPAKLNILGTMPSLSFGSPEERQEIRLSMSMLQRNRIELLNIQMNNNSQTMNPGGHVMSRQEQELAACEPDVSPGNAPRAIKTRGSLMDGPKNPYKSWHEMEEVRNNGVASFAGLRMVNRKPTHKVTKEGRYKVGNASAIKNNASYSPYESNNMHSQPFLSMA